MKTLTRVVVLVSTMTGTLSATASSSIGQGQIQATPPVADAFKPFYVVSNDVEAARAALPCEMVSLEKSGGMFMPGGLFRLTLSKNGEATLWSESGTFGRTGDFVGTVDAIDLGKLCHLISDAGIDKMARRFASRFSDQHTLTLAVTTAKGRTAIEDYGGAGPLPLWTIHQAMIAIGSRIPWKRK